MPIATLDSAGGRPALVFRCDTAHDSDLATTEPLLLVDDIAWPPSAISEARRRGWTVNAMEVKCPTCTGKIPRFLRDYLPPDFDDSHP